MSTLIFGRMVVHNERINERRSYIFLELSCANKIIKLEGMLNPGRMVVLNASVKIPERDGSISPSSSYGQLTARLLITRFLVLSTQWMS